MTTEWSQCFVGHGIGNTMTLGICNGGHNKRQVSSLRPRRVFSRQLILDLTTPFSAVRSHRNLINIALGTTEKIKDTTSCQ